MGYTRQFFSNTSFHQGDTILLSSQRGGTLYCEYQGDRIILGGKAVLYSIAEIDF